MLLVFPAPVLSLSHTHTHTRTHALRCRRSREMASPSSTATVKRVYLLGYNVAQAAGWGVVAFAMVKMMTQARRGDMPPTRVLRAVTLLQLVQLMEVVHAVVGTTRRDAMRCDAMRNGGHTNTHGFR